jgi:hypothetical protein
MQVRAVATVLNAINRLRAENGDGKITLIAYRSTSDMLPGEEWPTVEAHHEVLARIKEEAGGAVDLVAFDRADYEKWLKGREDTRIARLDWANERAYQGTRLAIHWGFDKSQVTGKNIQQALGWTVWRTGNEDNDELQSFGENEIPKD